METIEVSANFATPLDTEKVLAVIRRLYSKEAGRLQMTPDGKVRIVLTKVVPGVYKVLAYGKGQPFDVDLTETEVSIERQIEQLSEEKEDAQS